MQEQEIIINKKLSKRHKAFVEVFCGCPLEAAQIAGYTGTEQALRAQGNKLLADPNIMEAIKEKSRYLNKIGNAIASKEERKIMWTNIMNNSDPHHKVQKDPNGIPIPEDNVQMGMRLKASELLGKSEGDFVDRVDINSKISISDVILTSYDIKDKSLEDIEAEYMLVREKKKLAAQQEEDEEDEEAVLYLPEVEHSSSNDSGLVHDPLEDLI